MNALLALPVQLPWTRGRLTQPVRSPTLTIGDVQRIAQCMPDDSRIDACLNSLSSGHVLDVGEVLIRSKGLAVFLAKNFINQLPEFSISHLLRVTHQRRHIAHV